MVKNLRMLRLRKGISQQALANYLNITQQSVYRYEKEKFEPDISTLMALADYFGTTVDFLIGHAAPSQDAPREELALAKEELQACPRRKKEHPAGSGELPEKQRSPRRLLTAARCAIL